jgi:integrase
MVDVYDHAGRRIRKKVCGSKKLAEQAEADLKVKIAKEEFLGIVDQKKILFKDFAQDYLNFFKANRARSSYNRLKSTLGSVMESWEGKYLHEITTAIVERTRMERLKKVKPITVNSDMAYLGGLFSAAVKWDYLKESPLKGIKDLRVPKNHPRFLTREEADNFMEALRKSNNLYIRSLVGVALHTGMRKGELFNLKWAHVDFERGLVRVVSDDEHHTKNYESRVIPMNDALVSFLEDVPRHRESPYVFPGIKLGVFRDVQESFCNALERAGIPRTPRMGLHTLRHTFASWLVMSRVDLYTVMELMGHRDIKTTMIYAHLAPGHLKEAVDNLDRHYTRPAPHLRIVKGHGVERTLGHHLGTMGRGVL